jgi:hypothetical protein
MDVFSKQDIDWMTREATSGFASLPQEVMSAALKKPDLAEISTRIAIGGWDSIGPLSQKLLIYGMLLTVEEYVAQRSRKKNSERIFSFPSLRIGIRGIYSLTVLDNGMRYIGQALCVRERLAEHHKALCASEAFIGHPDISQQPGEHQNSGLRRAARLYGANGFKFELVEEVPMPDFKYAAQRAKQLDAREHLHNMKTPSHLRLNEASTWKFSEHEIFEHL